MSRSDAQAVPLVIQASTTETASGTGSPVNVPGGSNDWIFTLDVTAGQTAAADTLDVTLQTELDGSNWVDVVHFTQIAGDDAEKRYHEKINAGLAEAGFEAAATLAAGAVRNMLGKRIRAKWTIVDDTDPSFTFSVAAMPM